MRAERRSFEPWPWALAAALAAMIGISLGFYAIAAAYPDPPVVDDAWRAGLELNERLRKDGSR